MTSPASRDERPGLYLGAALAPLRDLGRRGHALFERHPGPVGFVLLYALAWVSRPSSWSKPVGYDAGQYLYVAQTILDGGMPYTDAANNKGPLTYLVFAALNPLAEHSTVLFRFAITGFIALAALAVAGYVSRAAGRPAGAFAGVTLAVLSASIAINADGVNTEHLGIAALAGAWYLSTFPALRRAAVSGALVGAAFCVNIVFAVVAPVIAWELWRQKAAPGRGRRLLVAAAGAGVVMVPLAIWLLVGGAMGAYLDLVFGQAFRVGGRIGAGVVAMGLTDRFGYLLSNALGYLWLIGVAAGLFAARYERLRPAALASVAWILLVLLRIKTTSYEYVHHYVLALPGLSAALALFVSAVWPSRLPERLALAVAILALVTFPAAIVPQFEALGNPKADRSNQTRAYARYRQAQSDFLERNTRPGEEIFAQDPWIYSLSDRAAPSRFFEALVSLQEDEQREQREDLLASPPKALALLRAYRDLEPAALILDRFPYRRAYDRNGVEVWILREGARSSSGD